MLFVPSGGCPSLWVCSLLQLSWWMLKLLLLLRLTAIAKADGGLLPTHQAAVGGGQARHGHTACPGSAPPFAKSHRNPARHTHRTYPARGSAHERLGRLGDRLGRLGLAASVVSSEVSL